MNIDREDYLSHIVDMDDLMHMRRILDKVEMVKRDHTIESTDFLNPYIRKLAASILNRFIDISYREIGGVDEAERKCILIYPEYHYLTEEDYSISALRLIGPMDDLSHRDFLGAILNVGIDRDKVGDILLHDDHVDFIVKEEVEGFMLLNIDRIGNSKFDISKIMLDELEFVGEDYEEKYGTLSSQRLDVFISAAYNLSRRVSQDLIRSNRARVNWEEIDDPAYEINESDMVSLRGYGRSILSHVGGKSRKDRLKVKIKLLI